MHYYLQFMLVLLRTSSERCAAVICRASEWLADDEQKENHNQYTYCYWLLVTGSSTAYGVVVPYLHLSCRRSYVASQGSF